MKTITIIASIILISLSINAQTPNWLWAKGTGGGYISTQSIAKDASGNVYVTGNISDTMMIFGKDTLINEATDGAQNLFVVKYDSLGNVQWAKSANGGPGEGTEYVESAGIGVDAGGNVYLIGSYQTPFIIFGKDTLISIANGTSFLVKYNGQGNSLWSVNIGNDLNTANAIAVDANGNSYIVGNFTSGSFIGGTDTITNTGYVSAYTIKYDSSGNSIWAAGISGGSVVNNYAVAFDAAGNTYVTGGVSGDSIVAGNITLHNTGVSAVYTVKYDPTGKVAWVQSAGVNSNINPTGISTDAKGNAYIIGTTTGDTLAFGNDTAFTGAGGLDNFFTAKYDSSGNIKWLNCSQGYPYAYAGGISADSVGNTYVTGYFENTTLIIGKDTLIENDTLDETEALFVAKYDSSGNAIWALGGTVNTGAVCGGAGIVADNNGNFYISGNYSGPGIKLGNDTLPFSGNVYDENFIFVAKYGTIATVDTTGIPLIAASSITVYPNPSTGQFYFKGINTGSTLDIYDVLGQNIFTTVVNNENYLLNISAQAKGVYLYRVVNNADEVQQGKIIIQ